MREKILHTRGEAYSARLQLCPGEAGYQSRTNNSRLAPLDRKGSFREGSTRSSTCVPTGLDPVGRGVEGNRFAARTEVTTLTSKFLSPRPVNDTCCGLSGLLSLILMTAPKSPGPAG